MSHARMRSVTNYFIVNLSIADIINATLNVIPNFTYMLTGNWPFGKNKDFLFLYLNIIVCVNVDVCKGVTLKSYYR